MFPEEGSLQYSFLKIDQIFSHFVVVVDRLHASLNDGMKLQTSWLKDLKMKGMWYISTCGTSILGNNRITCHYDTVNNPQVAENYL